MNNKWSPNSWRSKNAKHMPKYADESLLKEILNKIKEFPPLVFAEDFSFLVRLLLFRPCGKTRKHNYISHKWIKSNEIPFSDAKGSNSQGSWHNC